MFSKNFQYILHRIIHFGFRFAKLRIYKTFLISIHCNSLFLGAVENDNRVDIIICGGGASGLLLANGLVQDPAFDHLKILLIEKEDKSINDRTWSFWEEGNGDWEDLIHHRWDKALFKASDFHHSFALAPYQYKMIRGLDFYNALYPRLKQAANLTLIREEITGLDAGEKSAKCTQQEQPILGKKFFLASPKIILPSKQTTLFCNNTLSGGLYRLSAPFLILLR